MAISSLDNSFTQTTQEKTLMVNHWLYCTPVAVRVELFNPSGPQVTERYILKTFFFSQIPSERIAGFMRSDGILY